MTASAATDHATRIRALDGAWLAAAPEPLDISDSDGGEPAGTC